MGTRPSVSVRPAVLADAHGAVDVLRASITKLCVADHKDDPATLARWLHNKTAACFEDWLHDGGKSVTVAVDGDSVCGVGLIQTNGHIRLCFVQPGRQRAGVGGALLVALEARAASWGAAMIHLTSTEDACAFYEHHGYRPDGATRTALDVMREYPYAKDL